MGCTIQSHCQAVDARTRSEILRAAWPAAAFVATLAAVFVTHLPVLDHYFFGDDFVPLADMTLRTTPGYVKDLFLLEDATPNWRFLTGLVYFANFRAFGVDAFPFMLTAVAVHTATAGLIFWLVRRATGAVWPAVFAGALFGLSASHVPTVGQVTAFNNVLAGAFIVLGIVLLYEGLEREGPLPWVAAAAVSFVAAIASNDSAAVVAPVLGLVALWKGGGEGEWWRVPRAWVRPLAIAMPFLVIGSAALIAFGACECTQASRGTTWGSGDHIAGNIWIYLGRLVWPIVMEAPGEPGTAHIAAGTALMAVGAVALVRGPALARIAVVFIGVSIVPYVPLYWALAPRYVYLAAIPFSILGGLMLFEIVRLAARHAPALLPAVAAAVATLALGALALHGWQQWEQNDRFAGETDEWRELVAALDTNFDDLPEQSKIYIRGGPLTMPLLQFTVLPAVGEVLYGGVVIAALPEETEEFCLPPAGEMHVLDYDGGAFTPVEVVDERPATVAPGEPRPAIAITCPVATFDP